MTDTAGIPVGVTIDGANRNDCKLVELTIQSIPIKRPDATPEQPQGVCLDKAYDHQFVREILAQLDLTPQEARELRADLGERARRWVEERIHS